MFVIGDKITIIEYAENKYNGKHGEILFAETGIKRNTQPIVVDLPKLEAEPRYIVKLDSGEIVKYLREQELQKFTV